MPKTKKTTIDDLVQRNVSRADDEQRDPTEFSSTSSLVDPEVRSSLRRNRAAGFISLDLIEPDPNQPRTVRTDTEEFEGFVATIEDHGVISPITVRALQGGRYRIITGERRYRAACQLGLQEIPALVREVGDTAKVLQEQLIENIQREDMNPVEEAQALEDLEVAGLTHDEIGKKIGKSRAYVTNMIRLPKKLTRQEQAYLVRCSPANMPGKSLILEALRTDDARTRWAILTGKLTRSEARSSATSPKGSPSARRVPKNTLIFPIPGHGTWTFKQERSTGNSKHIDASRSYAKLRLLIDRAIAPLPEDRKDENAHPSND